MNLKKQVAALLFAASLFNPHKIAAQKTEPIFEVSAGSLVNSPTFLLQASTGELITGNALKLIAINPDKKTIAWENKEFIGLEEDDVSVIDGTPFIRLKEKKQHL